MFIVTNHRSYRPLLLIITESLRFLHNSPRSCCHISSGRTLFNVSFMHVFLRRFMQSFPTDRLCSCSCYLFIFFRFRNLKKMSSIPSKGTTIGSVNMIRSWRFIHINYNGWLPWLEVVMLLLNDHNIVFVLTSFVSPRLFFLL